MNPQAAVDIAQGHGRVRSFLEQIQPGQGRPMPIVAGIQREGNTPMTALPRIAGAAPTMPQTVIPTMPSAHAAGVSLMGLNQLRSGFSTWPRWLKVLLPIMIVGSTGLLAWGLAKHYKRKNIDWPDID